MLSLLDATIDDLSRALNSHVITAVELTRAYLSRINEVDNYFHAVLETNPDAISIAAALDEEQAATGRRGSHHPSPVASTRQTADHLPVPSMVYPSC